MNQALLVKAFEYKRWSDRRILDAIAAIDAGQHPQALAFTLQQLNHMCIVEELFRARLLGLAAPHASTNTEVVPGLGALGARLGATGGWYVEFAMMADESDLDEPLSFIFTDGQHGRMSRREILFHILNHGSYHRGAIGHALDLARAPRPADTYSVFIHQAEPERRA